MITLYTLYFFTSFVDVVSEGQFTYNVGFLNIGMILFCIIWNMTIITRKVISILKKKLRIIYQKRKKKE